MKKIIGAVILMSLVILSLGAEGAAAEDPFQRKNAIAFKLGAQFFSDSEFTDFWGIDDGNLIGPVLEIDYDRKIIDFLFVGVTLGYAGADKKSDMLAVDNAAVNVGLNNLYLSPTLKALAPLSESLSLYGGLGPDIYYADYDIEISLGDAKTRITDDRFSFGAHALIGLEWLFYKKPVRDGWLDAPLGLVFEYKFATVPVNDYDQKAIDLVNTGLGTSYSANDFAAGGHFLSIGLKWHF
jgi:hypothetical protein